MSVIGKLREDDEADQEEKRYYQEIHEDSKTTGLYQLENGVAIILKSLRQPGRKFGTAKFIENNFQKLYPKTDWEIIMNVNFKFFVKNLLQGSDKGNLDAYIYFNAVTMAWRSNGRQARLYIGAIK